MSYTFICVWDIQKDLINRYMNMREWLSGGVSPCQGEGRGFESRLALTKSLDFQGIFCCAECALYLH